MDELRPWDNPTVEAWDRCSKTRWNPKDDPMVEVWGRRTAAGRRAWDNPTTGTLETVGGPSGDPMRVPHGELSWVPPRYPTKLHLEAKDNMLCLMRPLLGELPPSVLDYKYNLACCGVPTH